ncbi:MAG TPA: response regulator [Rhizomicrobium sp.]|jgi:CheY-like chemotaxis protein|nr:response regulator [Rhizomicrobium sp.]
MSDASNKTAVLIAEDEAMLRFVAVETLRDEGFVVFEACDGADALGVLREHPEIRLLISDIKMPRLGGYELAEAALALRPALKILLMTGYAQDPSPAFVQSAGIPTLHKPFELERLSHLAGELLGAA